MYTTTLKELVDIHGSSAALRQLNIQKSNTFNSIVRLVVKATGRSSGNLTMIEGDHARMLGTYKFPDQPIRRSIPVTPEEGAVIEFDDASSAFPENPAFNKTVNPTRSFAMCYIHLYGEVIGGLNVFSTRSLPRLTEKELMILEEVSVLCSKLIERQARMNMVAMNAINPGSA